MASQPPAFENADKCRGCSTAFSLFTRKHHCRNCGRTFCQACSQGSMPLPHFQLLEPVRVCQQCEQTLKKGPPPARAAPQAARAAPAPAAASASSEARAPAAETREVLPPPPPAKIVKNCTCGSPLCICPPDPEEKVAAPPAAASSSSASVSAAPAKKPQPTPAPAATSTFHGFGSSSKSAPVYDLRGDLNEQVREAVKAGDVAGVKQLLEAGASAKYVDRTGNALAHLAAMFNRLDIIELLARHGADLWVQNPSRETPVDLAPPALQRKMKDMQPQA